MSKKSMIFCFNSAPVKPLQELINSLEEAYENHAEILARGSQDFLWPDGARANLVRSHIVYFKSAIRALCKERRLPLPEIALRAIPAYMPSYFCASCCGGRHVLQSCAQ